MRATGIVRKTDELGRIVIPKELRRTFDISEGDSLEIFVDAEGEIILRKYQPFCVFCGSSKGVKQFHNKNICLECVKAISAGIGA